MDILHDGNANAMLYNKNRIEKEIRNKLRKKDLPPYISELPPKRATWLFLYRWVILPLLVVISTYKLYDIAIMNINLLECLEKNCKYAEVPQVVATGTFVAAPYVLSYLWLYITPFSHIFAYRYLFHIYIVGAPILISTSVLWSLYTHDVAHRKGYVRCVSKWDSPHDIARPFARSPDLCEEALKKF